MIRGTKSIGFMVRGIVLALALTGCGKDEGALPRNSTPVDAGLTPSVVVTMPLPSASATGVVGPSSSMLAAPCLDDADCGDLRCSRSDSTELFGGGAAGGYCTATCETHTECEAIEQNARCVQFTEGVGTCVAPCELGDSALDSVKCQGRPELACDQPEGFAFPVCLPSCMADSDCDGDRHCALDIGVCGDEVVETTPIGTACTTNTDCAGGFCLQFSDTYAICSGYCTFGAPGGCGTADRTQSGPGDAICTLPAGADNSTADRGYCGQACNCDGDCLEATSKCLIIPGVSDFFGTNGYCVEPGQDASTLPDGWVYGMVCPAIEAGADAGHSAVDAAVDASDGSMMSLPPGDAASSSPLPDASLVVPTDAATDGAANDH